jgi:ribA/ribD-fused uncharacterized protein
MIIGQFGFVAPYRFLSNFYPTPILFDGMTWPSVEHAYQAQKTNDIDIRVKILHTASPSRAKRLGKHYNLRKDWEQVKVGIMRELLRFKFPVGGVMSDELVATHLYQLVEGNTWHDNFWGNCVCADCAPIVGKNVLGYLLEQRRAELQHFQKAS